MMREIKVGDYVFHASTELEAWRAKTLFTKEKGTVQWLQKVVKKGDIFYDIGANIGLYTVVAAKLGAYVYAFEPHVVNAASLLRNVAINGLSGSVRLITAPLHSSEKFLKFNYTSLKGGSSGHQLGHTVNEQGKRFTPETVELKLATTIDRLVKAGAIQKATLVKMDVDGNEKHVLAGMQNLLVSSSAPRNIQVEIHPELKKGILKIMADAGYPAKDAGRHDTMHGKDMISKGIDPELVAYNVIFRKPK